tara:strand:- start:2072 stop:2863 length:792 start_codon:yes stop_codon:yes gene_type:complete
LRNTSYEQYKRLTLSCSSCQAASASAETAAADVFSAVSNRVSVLEKAFTDLVDAVTQELGDARGERKRWQQDAEALGVRIDRCEVTTAECAATCAALSTTFDDRAVARREALTAASAVTEARQALQAAERTHLEVNERLEALENVARDADAALQAQIDELGESAARAEFRRAGAGGGQVSTPGGTHVVTTRDILLAGAASEADVVALRDWTKQVTESHAARLTKVETFVLDGKKSRSSKKPSTNAEPTPTSRPRKEEESEGSA